MMPYLWCDARPLGLRFLTWLWLTGGRMAA